ncbi:hypothetical protein [Taibaiella helva]|uniref:hypothetical protein n=1 Tax=Taibaiella helva TaxID=2301235 RepID=UPI0013009AA5|nr:hypothetical protein [Taibaiella helva]
MPGQERKQYSSQQISSLLARRFVRDYEDMLTAYTPTEQLELTNHLLMMLEQLNRYSQQREEKYYQAYYAKEDALLQKYGSRFQAYHSKRFYQYFYLDLLLAETDIYTDEEYNGLEEQSVTPEQMQAVVTMCNNVLYWHRTNLYLQDAGKEPQEIVQNEAANGLTAEATDKEATKSRQLLAIYYLLKALGIEARNNGSVSSVARWAHLLTGTKFTTIQNSDIYKKYLRMPNYKTDVPLIEDLKFIRPYFVDLGIEGAVGLIDEELARAIKELPYGLRKKYKDNTGG